MYFKLMALRGGICLLLFCIQSVCLQGQAGEFVQGSVVDLNTQEPVAFATVRLKDRALGVITNPDGGFRIPLRFRELEEILIISCLGYQNREVRFSDLTSAGPNRVTLTPQPLLLEEAVVLGKRKRPPSPRRIVKRAIEKIPENYPVEPFAYVGYYRDYQQKGREYVNLNEALLRVTDMGFGTNDFEGTQVQLYDYRENTQFRRDTLAEKPYNYASRDKIIQNAYLYGYGGNEWNILRIHDAIRNYRINTFSFVNRFEKDLLPNHSVSRKNDALVNGKRMFVISLEKSRPTIDPYPMSKNKIDHKFRAEGSLYISQDSYAIHKLVYKVFDETGGKSSREPKESAADLLYEVAIEYNEEGGRMYPNYISFHNVFTLRRAPFYVKDITLDFENKCFIAEFSNDPVLLVDKTVSNFVVKFKRKRLKLDQVVRIKDRYHLFPDPDDFVQMAHELTTSYDESAYFSPDVLEFNFSGIYDRKGNELHQYKSEQFHQYREFFTQRISPEAHTPVDPDQVMNKNAPISRNQPLVMPSDFQDYWMNTPLKIME
ncbi:carboxypeptidase-like regulatory domain-containing protein [Robiginitalea sediminis]|uniref:carboxypeptidase-like regulatory domain-containing protein n=1 Tax=Robiginitalea sediminis TaxID=1982593 RepID=UPI000B4B4901|nr:carboxypeptidase-like regulatory domain-containing protein [Robiginitalea sediminis]